MEEEPESKQQCMREGASNLILASIRKLQVAPCLYVELVDQLGDSVLVLRSKDRSYDIVQFSMLSDGFTVGIELLKTFKSLKYITAHEDRLIVDDVVYVIHEG